MTIRLSHLGDREKWEDTLKEYIKERKQKLTDKLMFPDQATKDRVSISEYIELSEGNKTERNKDILHENISEGQKSLSNHIMSQSSKHLSMCDEEEKGEEMTDQMLTRKIMDPSCSLPNVLPNIYVSSQNMTEGMTMSNLTSAKTIDIKHTSPERKIQNNICKTDRSSFMNTAEKLNSNKKFSKNAGTKVLA